MAQKQIAYNDSGQQIKRPGWFSWRHQNNDEHLAANVGRSRSESRARKHAEAEARDASLPADSPRRRRNRLADGAS